MDNSLEMFTKEELAAQLKVSSRTIDRAIKNGALQVSRVGKQVRILKKDALTYMKSNLGHQK